MFHLKPNDVKLVKELHKHDPLTSSIKHTELLNDWLSGEIVGMEIKAIGRNSVAPEMFSLSLSHIDDREATNDYHYDNEVEYESDLEALGFYNREYFIFGQAGVDEYERACADLYRFDTDIIKDGNACIHMHDKDNETTGDLLSAFDGWGGMEELSLSEYRYLNNRLEGNQVAESDKYEIRAVFYEGEHTRSMPFPNLCLDSSMDTIGVYETNEKGFQHHMVDMPEKDFKVLMKSIFYSKIKPRLIEMTIDGSLPSDMNELGWEMLFENENQKV